jgi:hypothetical protein
VESLRCPTCIGLLPDAPVRRCPSCGQSLRRRGPRVLGEGTRIGTSTLPIDRWMLDRLEPKGRTRGRELPPVPWDGRFTTPPIAEPDLPAIAAPVPAARPLDVYADASPTITMPEAPLAPAPLAPRPQPIHEELRPDVRALIDELYEQARAELAGETVGFFAPVAQAPVDEPVINEPAVNELVVTELLVDEIVAEPRSEAPAEPNASSAKRPGRPRSRWVAAIQTAEWQHRPSD